MVGFKNRYLVMEVFLDPSGDISHDDPIILTQFNVSKAIKDSILLNFGECGLGSILGSFQVKYVNRVTKTCVIKSSCKDYQNVWSAITMIRRIGNCPVIFSLLDLSGNIRTCKIAALKCDQAKFEQYKLIAGDSLTPQTIQECTNCFEKIKVLEN